MPAAYRFKHPRVQDVDSLDLKVTDLAKNLFDISPPGQGFVGFIDLLSGEVHICPVFNKGDGLERKTIEYNGIDYAVQSAVPLNLSSTATVTGGDAHKNARVRLKLMEDKEHSGNLLGFGFQKGKSNSLIESFRNRSASLNLLAIEYDEEYLNLQSRKNVVLRSMPDDITEKTIQALCRDLPLAGINQQRVLKVRRLITPLDCSSAQFAHMLPLHHAAALGDLTKVDNQLSLNPSAVNEQDTAGWTPLIHAARQGRTEVVKALLQAGASVNAADNAGETPLMHAVSRGEDKVVRALLEAGASINQADNAGVTPFMRAVAHGNSQIARILYEQGSVVTDSLARLWLAVAVNDKEFLASQAENILNDASSNRQEILDEILLRAVMIRNVKLVEKLLEKGASPGAPDQVPFGALSFARFMEITEMIEALTQRVPLSQSNSPEVRPLVEGEKTVKPDAPPSQNRHGMKPPQVGSESESADIVDNTQKPTL